MIGEWTLSKLEAVKESPRVVVWDSLRLLSEADGTIDRFASQNSYTVIMAATNLAFRDLYEQAVADPDMKKLLVIDRAPARRRKHTSVMKAPPLFYPDLLADTPPEARIHLDLRQFLKEKTGDPNWPQEVNEPRYARLIAHHLEGVLRGHQNLRTAHESRFTDNDFKKIVAFAALGVAESAFKQLEAKDYWTIGLLGHEALSELDELAPEITKPIRDELVKAPAPFCWFANRDPDSVIRAFYLSVILSQHTENWTLLLANIDPVLSSLSGASVEILRQAAPQLVAIDPVQATHDLETVENSLNRDALQLLLLDQLHLSQPASFTAAIAKERYSTLFRSLALLLALDNLLSPQPAEDEQSRIAEILLPEGNSGEMNWVDTRSSATWSDLKKAYQRAAAIQKLREALAHAVRTVKVRKTELLTFKVFWEAWNKKQFNRLEYYLSDLERLVDSAELLPRPGSELPSLFGKALLQIRQRVRQIAKDVHQHLGELNRRFQELVALQYPTWIAKDGEVYLTSQFLRRCLKPHWDPQKEKAVIFIFDGMRYDIWDELLKPMLITRMNLIEDFPAASILPSETHITRKAISAGTYPDSFDTHHSENRLLQSGLLRELNYTHPVEAIAPESAGTGETVRYRAGNLDVYIFELCDTELHGIEIKTQPDGREVPSRPLAFIYQQQLKNIIDTEVMAIARCLESGTKVFITADHGFGPVGRQRVWFEEEDLNEASDCVYLNCSLKVPFAQAQVPAWVREQLIAFTPEQLRLPATQSRTTKSGQLINKEYKAMVFPKVGYSFSRPRSHYNPDAYSHGGISIQELMIPMVVLEVKAKAKGLLTLGSIVGNESVVEGEEIEFRMRLSRNAKSSKGTELRVEVEASYGRDTEHLQLPRQVSYVPVQGTEVVYRFRPDVAKATPDEQRAGIMKRLFTATISYQEGRKTIRNSQTKGFAVKLNSERVVRRVPSHLGNILGLTPKSMR